MFSQSRQNEFPIQSHSVPFVSSTIIKSDMPRRFRFLCGPWCTSPSSSLCLQLCSRLTDGCTPYCTSCLRTRWELSNWEPLLLVHLPLQTLTSKACLSCVCVCVRACVCVRTCVYCGLLSWSCRTPIIVPVSTGKHQCKLFCNTTNRTAEARSLMTDQKCIVMIKHQTMPRQSCQ
jgi:hypothetical protein